MEGKILIVDDGEGIRNSLRDYFDRQGFNMLLAENGVQAVEMVRQKQPDVVILDVQIPFLDGAVNPDDAYEFIRAELTRLDVPQHDSPP